MQRSPPSFPPPACGSGGGGGGGKERLAHTHAIDARNVEEREALWACWSLSLSLSLPLIVNAFAELPDRVPSAMELFT